MASVLQTPRLTVNYSQSLCDLVHAAGGASPGEGAPLVDGAPLCDGVEVGPWFSVEQIEAYRRRLPGLPFHLHMGSLAARLRWKPGTMARLQRHLACTDNDWLSFHVELLPWPLYLVARRLGIHLPPPGADRAAGRFVRAVKRIRAAVGLPVLVENLASLPEPAYHYAADPALLGRVLAQADCGLLLDVAHARLAAIYRGQPAEAYLAALPLERVRQVHVSGIRRGRRRRYGGGWYDAHESLQEEDYRLVAWVLERCRPEVVTLEYFREAEPLRAQLLRLRAITVAHPHNPAVGGKEQTS